MIPHRLKFPLREHSEIFKNAMRTSGQFVDMFIHPALENIPQASVIVGKNISSKAVDRNRMKRRVLSILRQDILPKESRVLVIRTKSKSKTATYAQLKNDLISLASTK